MTGRMRTRPGVTRATRPPWLIRRPVELLMKRFVRRDCGLVVEGRHRVPQGAFIVCTNHRSHVDSVVIMTALGIGFEACGLVAATDYFFAGWRRRLMASAVFTLIPLERAATVGSFRRSIEACGKFIQGGGQAIVMYPEGSRSQDGMLAPFKRGPAALALALGLPIVPGFIVGSERVMPKGHRRAVRAPLTLRVGEALLPAAFTDPETGRGCSRDMTAALVASVMRLGHGAGGDGGSVT